MSILFTNSADALTPATQSEPLFIHIVIHEQEQHLP